MKKSIFGILLILATPTAYAARLHTTGELCFNCVAPDRPAPFRSLEMLAWDGIDDRDYANFGSSTINREDRSFVEERAKLLLKEYFRPDSEFSVDVNSYRSDKQFHRMSREDKSCIDQQMRELLEAKDFIKSSPIPVHVEGLNFDALPSTDIKFYPGSSVQVSTRDITAEYMPGGNRAESAATSDDLNKSYIHFFVAASNGKKCSIYTRKEIEQKIGAAIKKYKANAAALNNSGENLSRDTRASNAENKSLSDDTKSSSSSNDSAEVGSYRANSAM